MFNVRLANVASALRSHTYVCVCARLDLTHTSYYDAYYTYTQAPLTNPAEGAVVPASYALLVVAAFGIYGSVSG